MPFTPFHLGATKRTPDTGSGASGHVGSLVAAVRNWLRHPRAAITPDQLGDAALADVGLVRADIGAISSRDRL